MSFIQENWNYIIDAILALGAMATALSFIVLFRKDKHKKAQIDALTRMVEGQEKQSYLNEQRLIDQTKPRFEFVNIKEHNLRTGKLAIKNTGDGFNFITMKVISDYYEALTTEPEYVDTGNTKYLKIIKIRGAEVGCNFPGLDFIVYLTNGSGYLTKIEGRYGSDLSVFLTQVDYNSSDSV